MRLSTNLAASFTKIFSFMKTILQSILTTLFLVIFALSLTAQCPDNIISNGGFEAGNGVDWWNWHDNSPDAYTFGNSDDAFEGDSSAVINILVDTDDIPGGQGGEYNSRPTNQPSYRRAVL